MSGPGNYDPSAAHQPPSAQGFNQYPAGNGYNDPGPQHASYDPNSGHPVPPGFVPPHQPPPSSYDPNNFPPPPGQDEYMNDGYGQGPAHTEYDRGYDRAAPSEYSHQPSSYNERPYAPSEPRGHEGNAVTPYDEERAEAEARRGYEEDQRRRYDRPGPPTDYELRNRRRGYDDRDSRYDDRYSDYRDERDRRSYSGSRYDSRERRQSDRRRRDSRQSPTSPKSAQRDLFGGREGERGLGAQILGGAVGGLAGHELGGGLIETLGGIVVGAVGAKALENQHEKRKSKKEEAMRSQAPYKVDAVTQRHRRSSYPESRPPRDDRTEYSRDRRDRRSPSRRSRSGRRGGSESDSYSSDGSPPPPRR